MPLQMVRRKTCKSAIVSCSSPRVSINDRQVPSLRPPRPARPALLRYERPLALHPPNLFPGLSADPSPASWHLAGTFFGSCSTPYWRGAPCRSRSPPLHPYNLQEARCRGLDDEPRRSGPRRLARRSWLRFDGALRREGRRYSRPCLSIRCSFIGMSSLSSSTPILSDMPAVDTHTSQPVDTNISPGCQDSSSCAPGVQDGRQVLCPFFALTRFWSGFFAEKKI